jgi:hypothetical protein
MLLCCELRESTQREKITSLMGDLERAMLSEV